MGTYGPSAVGAETGAGMTHDLVLRPMQQGDMVAWDQFVDACPDATFFHRAAWQQVISEAFGHVCHYWLAERGAQIVAILPLVRVKSWLFGDNLVSMPFGVYGGVVATDQEAGQALERKACELAEQLSVGSLEMRYRSVHNPDWPTKPLYFTFRREIDPDPEINMKAIPRKQRAMVRKGIKAGLQGRTEGDVDKVYDIYAESVRNLGTPVFPRHYFHLLKQAFGDDCEILLISHQGQDVAGVMSFYFREEVLPFYGGSRPLARQLKANDFMYWELMCRAAKRGTRMFDFGRSKNGTGSYSFKKNWGFEPEPLFYEYHLVKDETMPEVNPMNPKYRFLIKTWKRLPLRVANLIGPHLSPYLG